MLIPYPKIFSLGTIYIKNIFNGEVELTEKVDGSMFLAGKIDGKLLVRSKGSEIYRETCPKMFRDVVNYVYSIEDRFEEGFIYYGETLSKPKHNVLFYERVPKNNWVLFGIYNKKLGDFISDYSSLVDAAKNLDIDVVPLLLKGSVTIEDIPKFLERESYLGKVKIEGVVVKNYAQKFLLGGQPMPLMAGKLVSEAFKEVHRHESKENSGKRKWEIYEASFRTEARWDKAIQHLLERQLLIGAPEDIGKLLAEIRKDIGEEEKENIKEWLWKEYSQELLRSAVYGFPEYYKKKLMETNEII